MAMTSRERWLAAVRLQPVDRLPFWPKIGAAYIAAQAAPFSTMTVSDLHAWIGSDPHVGIRGTWRTVRAKTDLIKTRVHDEQHRQYLTPHGTLTSIEKFDAGSQSWHPVEFPIKSAEDLPILTAWFEDARVEVDPEALDKAREQQAAVGENASTHSGISKSALMQFVEHLAGVENAHFLLADAPEACAALFAAIHTLILRMTEIAAETSPADMLYTTENTSTTLISPAQYRQLNLPHVRAYADIMRQHDRNFVLHMCGHLKVILPDLATVGARAFEAFTSPTVGNTTLVDGRAACPDVCLIGGTNAAIWTRPAQEIIAHLEEQLPALPHHRGLVVTSGGMHPPMATPETTREVCRWVQGYGNA